MITVFTVALVPIIIATATFNLAVDGTQNAMKKAGTFVLSKLPGHKKPTH